MPRLPILSREAFYTPLPNGGGFRMLDFHLVNTSLGAMIETAPLAKVDGKIPAVDVYDAAFTKISEFNGDQVYALTNQSVSGGVFQSFAR